MGKIEAVDMVRKIRDRMYAQTRGKTHEELIRYYRQKAQASSRKTTQPTK